MERPDELVLVRACLDQRHTHQRRRRENEPTTVVSLEIVGEPGALLTWSKLRYVLQHEGHRRARMDHLYRLVEIVEVKRGAQHRVSLHRTLPGLFERRHIDLTAQRS